MSLQEGESQDLGDSILEGNKELCGVLLGAFWEIKS